MPGMALTTEAVPTEQAVEIVNERRQKNKEWRVKVVGLKVMYTPLSNISDWRVTSRWNFNG